MLTMYMYKLLSLVAISDLELIYNINKKILKLSLLIQNPKDDFPVQILAGNRRCSLGASTQRRHH